MTMFRSPTARTTLSAASLETLFRRGAVSRVGGPLPSRRALACAPLLAFAVAACGADEPASTTPGDAAGAGTLAGAGAATDLAAAGATTAGAGATAAGAGAGQASVPVNAGAAGAATGAAGAGADMAGGAAVAGAAGAANAGQSGVNAGAMGVNDAAGAAAVDQGAGAAGVAGMDSGMPMAGAAVVDPMPDEPGVAPVLSDLMIAPNPNNVLSAIVTWKTDVVANSEVRFGLGGYQFTIKDEAYSTDHRVVVIGMRAENDYQLQAASTNASGGATLEGTFTSGALPSAVLRPVSASRDAAASQPGWTLTNLMGNAVPATIVMYDEEGEPVWYYINGTSIDGRGDIDAELVEGNRVLIGPAPGQPPREVDLEGNIVWEGPTQSGQEAMTHHASKLPNGNYALIRDVRGAGNLQGTQWEEITPDRQVVWSWNIFDHVTPLTGANTDWCHGNSVTFDFAGDAVYLNCRFLGTFKVQYSAPSDVLSQMGGTFDPTGTGDWTYDPPESKFSDTHDPEFADDGTVLVYDNGGFGGGGGFSAGVGGDMHSRVIKYQLDDTNRVATRIWEFPGDFAVDAWYANDWYSPYWGDVDRLPNGNVLIDGAVRSANAQSHIFEVRPEDGAVVWEIVLPNNIGTYRAERLPVLVQPYSE